MKVLYLVLLFLAVLASCSKGPGIRIELLEDSVLVHMETLGEYPTTITRIKLIDMATGTTVWEIHSGGRASQLWRVPLKGDMNPVLPPIANGAYAVTQPQGASSFLLQTGQSYQIQVWGEDPRFHSSAIFLMP